MPKYVIEREIPKAGKLTGDELKAIAQTYCGVVDKMGSQIEWVQSYVTANKMYCIFIASNKEMLREHARRGGLPSNLVAEVTSVFDPDTAE